MFVVLRMAEEHVCLRMASLSSSSMILMAEDEWCTFASPEICEHRLALTGG